jgi:hypothetical protein
MGRDGGGAAVKQRPLKIGHPQEAGMRQRFIGPGALSIVLLVLAGCGVSFHPRVGGGEQPPIPTDDVLTPRGSAGAFGGGESGSLIEQLCRARATPGGWVVVGYAEGGESCPPARDAGDAYNVKLVERHADKSVGYTMVVCADQTVPRNWVRARAPEGREACPGARVSEGASTVMAIRRVR